MSDIVEKTLVSLQSLMSGGSSGKDANRPRAFLDLIETVAGGATKRDQDLVVNKEIALLQQRLGQAGLKQHQIRECLIRAIYCEMLGYPVPFVYIHAIKLAQQGSFVDKRIGYLVSTLFLHGNHELVILLINTIQRDLKSTNILEVSMALTAVTYLVSPEMMPSIVDLVEEKLIHPKEMIRKKAVLVLCQILTKCPSSVRHLIPRLKSCIGDSDPEVVSSAVNAVLELAKVDASSCLDMVQPLSRVLHQVLGCKLPVDFDYHGLPAPWIQISILKVFALVGHLDASASSEISENLMQVLQRVDINHNIAYAVLYEAVCTVAACLSPSDALLEMASLVISKFLLSTNSSLKYMGLKALAQLVQNVHPNVAADHQAVVMECLRHPDASVRNKTLDLLFVLTNSANIRVVCPKIQEHLSATTDEYQRTSIILRTLDLIKRNSHCPKWYLHTLNDLLLVSTSDSLPKALEMIKTLLYDGTNDMNQDMELRKLAVKTYIQFLTKRSASCLPNEVLSVIILVMGKFFFLCEDLTADIVIGILTELLSASNSDILTADLLMTIKTLLANHHCSPVSHLSETLRHYLSSGRPLVRQQASELLQVLNHQEEIRAIITSTRTDWTLGFLDQYVVQFLMSDYSSAYNPPAFRKKKMTVMSLMESSHITTELTNCPQQEFQDALWASSDTVASGPSSRRGPVSICSMSTSSESSTFHSQHSANLKLTATKKARKVWSKEGYNVPTEKSTCSDNSHRSSSVEILDQTANNDNEDYEKDLNSEDQHFAKALFSSLIEQQSPIEVRNSEPATDLHPYSAAHPDMYSSTSSIQRISSDSGPSSNMESPLDVGAFIVNRPPSAKPHSSESYSPPFTLLIPDHLKKALEDDEESNGMDKHSDKR